MNSPVDENEADSVTTPDGDTKTVSESSCDDKARSKSPSIPRGPDGEGCPCCAIEDPDLPEDCFCPEWCPNS